MRVCGLVVAFVLLTIGAPAQVLQWATMNTTDFARLNPAKTVVLLTDEILEEHGPWLPTQIDGVWAGRATESLAKAIVARGGWTVVMVPPLPLGSDAANVLGRKPYYRGSLAVREETMRAVMMDFADALGAQKFQWVFIVSGHAGPRDSVALDAAGDYFHDTYGGRMVHLAGLMPVFDCCDTLKAKLTPAQNQANGLPLHADALEQSLGLYLAPQNVQPGYKTAPPQGATDFAALEKITTKPGWQGYVGTPSVATREIGERNFLDQSAALNAMALSILDGKTDPAKVPHYGALMYKQAGALEVAARANEVAAKARQQRWLQAHPAAH